VSVRVTYGADVRDGDFRRSSCPGRGKCPSFAGGAYNFTGTLHVAEIFGFRVRWLSCGVVCVILCFAVLVEHRLVTDGRQTGRQTQAHSKYRSVKTTRILITSLTYPKLVYIQKQNFKRIQLTDSRHCVSAGLIGIYQSSDVVIGHLFHMQ